MKLLFILIIYYSLPDDKFTKCITQKENIGNLCINFNIPEKSLSDNLDLYYYSKKLIKSIKLIIELLIK